MSNKSKPGTLPAFLNNALLSNTEECIIWPFCVANKYGRITINKKIYSVHRIVCEETHGKAPSENHQAAHYCNQTLCINPKHIRWDTPKGNQADRLIYGTDNRGEKQGCVKLTEENVRFIKNNKGKISIYKMAKLFNISKTQISRILDGKSWAWLEVEAA